MALLSKQVLESHQKLAGKTFRLTTNTRWYDERDSTLAAPDRPRVCDGTILKAVGYLPHAPHIIIWHLTYHVRPAGDPYPDPICLRELEMSSIKLIFFPGQRPSDDAKMFCLFPYPSFVIAEISAPGLASQELLVKPPAPPKRHIPDFPGKCPACSGPAYIGFHEITCQRGCKT